MSYRSNAEILQDPKNRVVITGCGLVTAHGIGKQVNALAFQEGKVSLRPVTVFDVSAFRAKHAGEVELDQQPIPELIRKNLGARNVTRLDRATTLLSHAVGEAWLESGWKIGSNIENTESIPIILGTSAGSMGLGEDFLVQKLNDPTRRRGLLQQTSRYQPQFQGQMLASMLGIQGPLTIISNACASGANAVGHAFRLVKHRKAKRVVCGGYDALSHLVFAGFDSLQALSPQIPRPFDAHRNGLAIGEGAAIFCIESLESAQSRGATILAEIGGYGMATDVHHLTQPHPQGTAALRSMTAACLEANKSPGDIDYLNSHGTGTPLNDVAEGKAIKNWAGEDTPKIKVSSTKFGIGHLLGGAGAVEIAVCLLSIQGCWIPPTTTIETLDPVCEFDLVREPREAEVQVALSNSFGFGGSNATVILEKWKASDKKTHNNHDEL